MTDRVDRAQGALLGLALGDAYASPLRGLTDETVRVCPLPTDRLVWTDDTRQVLVMAKAILDTSPGVLDPDALGHAMGRRFVEWSHSPRAGALPDGATLRGAAVYESTGHWRTDSDSAEGCSPSLRALPVALAFAGESLTEAARIQSRFSHGHAETADAAVATAWLVHLVMESGAMDRYAVRRAIAGLRGGWAADEGIANALQNAMDLAEKPVVRWLDDESMGSGWSAPSVLGLAVAAALVWGDDFATCVDRAARIRGDSEGVAALAGMLLGAAAGPRALPASWLSALQGRDEICAQATSLVHWSEVRRSPDLSADQRDPIDLAQQLVASLHLAGARFVPDRDESTGRTAIKVQLERDEHTRLLDHLAAVLDLPVLDGPRYRTVLVPSTLAPLGHPTPNPRGRVEARTSRTDPIQVAWLSTGLRGRIGLTFAPGKKAASLFGSPWQRDLDMDLERLASAFHVRLLIPLIEDHELISLQIRGLQERAEDFGIVVHRLPILDGGVPRLSHAERVVELALSSARASYDVCFHCRGGLGRAGTLAALCLIRLGVAAEQAMADVRAVRPGAIENANQERFIREYQVEVAGH